MDKILIIEDDLGLSETTSDVLRLEGFEVCTARNGADGIQKAFIEQPDLIICDISMPEYDGYQVHRTLQENAYTAVIPFIFLTARVEKEDIRNGMLMGADDYITKPFDIEQLILSVNARLKKRKNIQHINDEQFKSIVNNSPYGVLICDENFVPFYANTSLLKMLNFDENDIRTTPITDYLSADNSDLLEKLSLCTKGFKTLKFDGKVSSKTGKNIGVMFYCTTAKISGKSALVLNVIDKDMSNKALLKGAESHDDIIKNAVKIVTENKDSISKEMVEKLKEIFKNKPSESSKNLLISLTKRELEVLELVCKGYSNNEIADKLFISFRTVERHRTNLINKTYSKNIIDVIIYAIKNNLIDI